jgi:hypothetical protein
MCFRTNNHSLSNQTPFLYLAVLLDIDAGTNDTSVNDTIRTDHSSIKQVRISDNRASADDTSLTDHRRTYLGVVEDLRGGSDKSVVANFTSPVKKVVIGWAISWHEGFFADVGRGLPGENHGVVLCDVFVPA